MIVVFKNMCRWIDTRINFLSKSIVHEFNGINYYAFSGICPHAKWFLKLGKVSEKIPLMLVMGESMIYLMENVFQILGVILNPTKLFKKKM